MDDVSIEYVKDLVVTQQKAHSEVSLLLKEAYPDRRGFSLRSVRRFCLKNGIHAQNRLSNDELEQCTKEVVARVSIHEIIVFFVKKRSVLFATQKVKSYVFSGKCKYSPGRLMPTYRIHASLNH